MTAIDAGKRRWAKNFARAVLVAVAVSANVSRAAGKLPTPAAPALTADDCFLRVVVE